MPRPRRGLASHAGRQSAKRSYGAKASPEQDYLQAAHDQRAAEIETASARQQLQALGLPLRGSDNPAQFALRALADGTVIDKHLAVGETVTPQQLLGIEVNERAAALAGQVVSCTPKKVGRSVDLNKSAATVESGKWVGPVKAPVAGEVVAINDALSSAPGSINSDPYGSGWMVKMKPANWDGDSAALVTGGAVAAAFEAKMNAEGFAGCNP